MSSVRPSTSRWGMLGCAGRLWLVGWSVACRGKRSSPKICSRASSLKLLIHDREILRGQRVFAFEHRHDGGRAPPHAIHQEPVK